MYVLKVAFCKNMYKLKIPIKTQVDEGLRRVLGHKGIMKKRSGRKLTLRGTKGRAAGGGSCADKSTVRETWLEASEKKGGGAGLQGGMMRVRLTNEDFHNLVVDEREEEQGAQDGAQVSGWTTGSVVSPH